MCSLSW